MESVLVAEKREEKGKAAVRRLRRSGKVPVVVYGEEINPQPLSIDSHDLEMLLRKNISVISLKFDNMSQDVIIREVQHHPVKESIIHVDFFTLKKGHKVEMTIPVQFIGSAVGVKTGGNFSILKHEVSISVFPKDIPDFVEVNIDDLDIGDSIRVRDLVIENVEFLDGENESVCHVVAPKAVEEVIPEGEEDEILDTDEEESTEPEVITARKDDSEE